MDEPDTNKLARHENVGSTIVPFKESARVTGVSIANGGTWDQSNIPYNADYPFNKVFASESGHLMEFDDTSGSERIHLYHKTGTFVEIDGNGTQVNRIVGDSFEVLERNGYVYVKGALNVNVEGANTLKVSGTADIEINGKTTINVYNDVELNVSGNADISIGETLRAKATSIKMEADDFHITSNGLLNITGQAVNILGTTTNMQATTALNIKGDIATLIHGGTTLDIDTGGVMNMNYSTSSFGIKANKALPATPSVPTLLLTPKPKKVASSVNFSI
jgi:hypothetical protein